MSAFVIPPHVREVLGRLHRAGYQAYLVGGCVRDHLLGRTPKDYDVATSALPRQTEEVFAGEPVIETGIRHGTVTVALDGQPVEVTTYRVDGGYSDGRHPDQVTFTRSLAQDAARRDFTINAMAYDPVAGLWDGFGGQEDLKRGVIRCVGHPATRFHEDGLRILRAVRFASELGFTLEENTAQAARDAAPSLERIAKERLSAELGKLLCGSGAGEIIRTYPDILGVVVPELLPMVNFDQRNVHHCYDLLTHTAVAVDETPPQLHLRLAALLHDVAKPACFTLGEDGQGHFYGHAHRGMEMADEILRRLRFPRKLTEQVTTLIRYHDSVVEPDPKYLRRWLNKLGADAFFDLLALQRADTLAQAALCRHRTVRLSELEAKTREILSETPCLTVRDLAVNGYDLINLGYRGPAIGAARRILLDQVLDGALPNEKPALLQFLNENAGKPQSARRKPHNR